MKEYLLLTPRFYQPPARQEAVRGFWEVLPPGGKTDCAYVIRDLRGSRQFQQSKVVWYGLRAVLVVRMNLKNLHPHLLHVRTGKTPIVDSKDDIVFGRFFSTG